MKKHLFLIGFMSSGKTYWGKRLAEALGKPFVDLDQQLELGEQATIAELFARLGEDGFRALERCYLQSLAQSPPSIVATGGGTPCFFDNLAWMHAHGVTLWIDVPFEVLWRRLEEEERHKRPLLAQTTARSMRRLWQKRRACYQQADYTIPLLLREEESAFWARLHAVAHEAWRSFLAQG